MNKEKQIEYKNEIVDIQILNLESLFLIIQYALQNIMESSNDCDLSKWVIKSYIKVVKEETVLLNCLKRNLDKIDEEELERVLDMLDEVNDNTIEYFYGFLDNVQESFAFFKKYSYFNKITDTIQYRKEVYCTTLNLTHVQKFLGIKKSIWKKLLKHTIITEDETFWGVNVKLNNHIVEDIKIFVPPIKNLQTAKINVREFTHAYDMYRILGMDYVDNDYEKLANQAEINFEKEYVKNKVKQYFRPYDNI